MIRKHKILLVEDHRIVREGIRALFGEEDDLEVIGDAEDGQTALAMLGKLKPEIVLLDISMPGLSGLETLRQMTRRYPEVKVLILTMHKADEYILEALESGASGYILKDSSRDELLAAVRYVMSGKTYLSPEIQKRVVSAYLSGGKDQKPAGRYETLTHRERQILKLIAEGRTNNEMAAYLNISVKTVAKHRANLMTKLDLHNASALTAFAVTRGLLDE